MSKRSSIDGISHVRTPSNANKSSKAASRQHPSSHLIAQTKLHGGVKNTQHSRSSRHRSPFKVLRLRFALMRDKAKLVANKLIKRWLWYDRKYRWRWRLATGVAAGLILISVILPVVVQLQNNRGYQLSAATLELVGKTDPTLTSKLNFNPQTKNYEFNKDSVKTFDPTAQLKAQVGQPQKESQSLYSLDVAQDMSKGTTYYDTNSQLSFTLVPQFGAKAGKMQQGRLVYPLADDTQAVYTLKNNGLKEDIVVQKTTKDSLRYTYTLDLPKTLEARALPDGSGAIGIYSANPALFANISYGSDADKAAVQKARENGKKDTLVFGIPKPVITTSGQDSSSQPSARFELNGDQLTVIAEDLGDVTQPFSIDPSVVITSASDFRTNGNNEGNIAFAGGQIKRDGLTGGTIGSWSLASNGSVFSARAFASTATYNGYIYGVSGTLDSSNGTNEVQYALACTGPNSNAAAGCDSGAVAGELGDWSTTTPLPGNYVSVTSAVAYNGYLYVLGGGNAGNSAFAATYYAPICTGTNTANGCTSSSTPGSLGNWTAGQSLHYAVAQSQTAVYDGYVYVMGGCSGAWLNCGVLGGSNRENYVQRAQLNADGSIGTWDYSSNTLPEARSNGAAVAYNGYLYLMGGCINQAQPCAQSAETKYAKIAADGTLGAWVTSSNTFGHVVGSSLDSAVYNGYLYYFTEDGYGGSGKTMYTQYAQINANGSIGVVTDTSTYVGVGRDKSHPLVVNGYTYSIGGCTLTSCSNATNEVLFAKIDSAGVLRDNTWSNGSSVSGAANSYSRAAVAYNGYLYISGGFTGVGGPSNQVQYAPINNDGSLGAWATTTPMISGLFAHGLVAYGSYLYVIGGCPSGNIITGCTNRSNATEYAPINPDGSIGSWTSGASMTQNLNGRGVFKPVVYNGYIYALGGGNGGSNGEYSQINPATHALGTWNPVNYQLSVSVVTAYNGHIYGEDLSNGKVYEAPLSSSDGSIGTWSDGNAADLNVTSATELGSALFVVKGYIYSVQGDANSNRVQFARINNDGTISAWSTTQPNQATTGAQFSAAASNGGLYIINLDGSTQYQLINNGGSGITGPSTQGSTSNTPGAGTYWAGTASSGNYIYNVGGCNGPPALANSKLACGSNSMSSKVMRLPVSGLNVDTTQDFSDDRFGLGSAAYNGFLYVVGGCGSTNNDGNQTVCTSFKSDLQYAPIASDGSLGAWATNPTSLNTGRYGHSTVIYDGYLYVMGGCSAATSGSGNCATMRNDVEYALICTGANSGEDGCGATAGQVGTWHTSGSTFTTGRMYFAAAAYNGNLYVMGGCTVLSGGVCTANSGDVQSVTLNSDGSLGAWKRQDVFGAARWGMGAVAYNGYLYVAGGCPSTTDSCPGAADAFNTISYAPIGNNGLLGNWQTSPNPIQDHLYAHGVVLSAGNIMTVRGIEGLNQPSNSLRYAPLYSIPRKGTYSKQIDLGFYSNVRGISYNGDLPGGVSQISYRAANTSGVYVASGAASSLANLRCTGTNGVRYVFLSVTLDDSQRATFPDSNGAAANATDLNVLYEFARPPNIRLRGGKILQNGVQSALDTCKITAS